MRRQFRSPLPDELATNLLWLARLEHRGVDVLECRILCASCSGKIEASGERWHKVLDRGALEWSLHRIIKDGRLAEFGRSAATVTGLCDGCADDDGVEKTNLVSSLVSRTGVKAPAYGDIDPERFRVIRIDDTPPAPRAPGKLVKW